MAKRGLEREAKSKMRVAIPDMSTKTFCNARRICFRSTSSSWGCRYLGELKKGFWKLTEGCEKALLKRLSVVSVTSASAVFFSAKKLYAREIPALELHQDVSCVFSCCSDTGGGRNRRKLGRRRNWHHNGR